MSRSIRVTVAVVSEPTERCNRPAIVSRTDSGEVDLTICRH
jgi:hypothetical protein